jgi:murein DD-endopeptidase MepM/ murein hydrolase activator NlpD
MIWENREYPISQEFGHTWFSVRHGSWYDYGRAYGLDGFEHTGLDIGMPRGTPIYSRSRGRSRSPAARPTSPSTATASRAWASLRSRPTTATWSSSATWG